MKRRPSTPGLPGLLLIAVASSAAAGGCLNPRPEDFPSESAGDGQVEPSSRGPTGEPDAPEAPSNGAPGGIDAAPAPADSDGDVPDAGAPDASTAVPGDAGAPSVAADTAESP